jgi:tetratricopeptide (TPR) repeat protein
MAPQISPVSVAAMSRALIALALISASSVATDAQQVGQRVVTCRETALRSDGNQDRMIGGGLLLVVKKVDGDRLWVFYLNGYDSRPGWIDRADVVSLAKAIDVYSEEIKKNPTPEDYAGRAWLLKETGEYEKAIADCNEALRLDPNSTAGFNNRGNAWTAKKEYDKAIADYSAAIRIEPKCAIYWVGRGIALTEKGEFKAALSDFDEALRLDPKHQTAYFGRGKAWHLQNQLDKAIADYGVALSLNPDAAASYNRGHAWQEKREFDKAIADFTEAIRTADEVQRVDPHFAVIYYNRGRAFLEKKAYDRAIADFSETIRLSPKEAPLSEVYFNRGEAWRGKRDFDKVIADYSEALRLDPTVANVYHFRGNAWREEQQYDKALADFDQALKLDPKNSYIYSNRGGAWYSKKDYAKATADLEEAIKLDPKHGQALAAIAWLYAACPDARFRNGKKAVDNATKACELTDWKVNMYLDTLGISYAEAGDFDAAIKWGTKAAEKTYGSLKLSYQARVELYKLKRPYRDVGNW